MKIWVDADATPAAIKEILFRVAVKREILTTFVANALVRVPVSPYLRALQVPRGFDVADDTIESRAAPGDLVITADIPLAAAVLDKHAHALNPRGEFYSADSIREQLTLRDFMDNLRASGIQTGGPAPFSPSDARAFANQLDRFLARVLPR